MEAIHTKSAGTTTNLSVFGDFWFVISKWIIESIFRSQRHCEIWVSEDFWVCSIIFRQFWLFSTLKNVCISSWPVYWIQQIELQRINKTTFYIGWSLVIASHQRNLFSNRISTLLLIVDIIMVLHSSTLAKLFYSDIFKHTLARIWFVFDFPIASQTDFIDLIASNRLKLTLWYLKHLMLIGFILLYVLFCLCLTKY